MTAQPLSPVIPRSGTAVSKERAGRAAARRLPLARPVVPENFNPALKVDKPRRQASTRRALDGALVAEINQVAAATGDVPELDE